MRIYRMTATFGKLEQQTLELEPGLNIIHAPNEWGKSTWCAFLAAMLYGLDTRAKTTKTLLADKEHYAPWSGSPMSGRIDLQWQGRDITIERTTRGRIPLGEFRAYETDSGLAVPELSAATCGQLLLGAEQSVFRRAGFIRLSDLPVTDDEALRRRLNALVTTGDESGDAERLAKGLRELKNKCRYNKTGLIPQAELERENLDAKLREQEDLEQQCIRLRNRMAELSQWQDALHNHRQALDYARSRTESQRLAQAEADWHRASEAQEELRIRCEGLPDKREAERKLHQLRDFWEQWHTLSLEEGLLPQEPALPGAEPPFAGLKPGQALDMAKSDGDRYQSLRSRRPGLAALTAGGLILALAAAAAYLWDIRLLLAGLASLVPVILGLLRARDHRGQMAQLEEKYGNANPTRWLKSAGEYEEAIREYRLAMEQYRAARGNLDARLADLENRRQSLCGAQSPRKLIAYWEQVLRSWEEYQLGERECRSARTHLEAMQGMAGETVAPPGEDGLDYTREETARLISDAAGELQRLQNRLGQYQGRMETLGGRELLENRREAVNRKILELEGKYAAAQLGLETLEAARRELQRRFAPRISSRTGEIMEILTGGRYCRLTLGEDLQLSAGTGDETVLRSALWRSEGTVDQLYLALRLAVAEVLMPQAPIVLDDALVRFDDVRLRAALGLLEEMSQDRQILLFTCQSREHRVRADGGDTTSPFCTKDTQDI